MGSLLGFHPPQFSEDAAWLPAWLQASTIREASNQAFQCTTGQGLEEIQGFQQSISTREHGNFSDDGRYKSFRLFLSGEDNSSMHLPSCSTNHEVQYNLYLSSYEESDNSLNPIPNKSEAERFEFNQALSVHQVDAKVIPEEDIHKVGHNANEAYMVPSQQRNSSGISGHESLSSKEEKGIKPEVDARSLKVNVNDAVELTVAASEALIIHNIVNNEPSSELWTSSAVLEAAIRIKQARLEDVNETLCSSLEESSEIDFLSDLDESTMEDAYEDVGLTLNDLHGYESVISHVKDSYASGSYMSNTKQKHSEPDCLEVDSGSISTKQQHKEVNTDNVLLKRGIVLESFDGVTHKEDADYAAPGTENADVACDIEPMVSCSVEQADMFTTELVGLLKDGLAIGEHASPQTILRSSMRPGSSGYDETEDKMTNLVPDRFQSRWFGGWKWKKEVNVPAVTDHKYSRNVPELFVNETSNLSESADIAPDQNSCVQKHSIECKIVSQSSIALEGTYEKASNNGNLPFDDVLVSPLCSVVPCSFASDSSCHRSVEAQNCENQVNLEKPFSPTADADVDTIKPAAPQSTDFLHRTEISISNINRENSPIIRRQVASLRTYSMIYPRCDPYLGKERNRGESLPLKYAPNVLSSAMQSPVKTIKNPEQTVLPENNVELQLTKVFDKVESNCKSYIVPRRKRVRFLETEINFPQVKKFRTRQTKVKDSSVATRICKRLRSQEKRCVMDNKMLFRNLKFLLTGFSVKEDRHIKSLIRERGGIVLDDIPSPPTSRGKRYKHELLPLILCPRWLLTTKFLYGCAVNACILKAKWLFDSIEKGSFLPPKKYVILKENVNQNCMVIGKPLRCAYFIFDNIAIMLHGKHDFCTKTAKVVKHGGGLVFKTLHWLIKSLDSKQERVGVVVVEDENGISRQLKQCALEQKIPVMPFNWIVNSLYAGTCLPLPEHRGSSASLLSKLSDRSVYVELSEEI